MPEKLKQPRLSDTEIALLYFQLGVTIDTRTAIIRQRDGWIDPGDP
jgi:hypothetical protein